MTNEHIPASIIIPRVQVVADRLTKLAEEDGVDATREQLFTLLNQDADVVARAVAYWRHIYGASYTKAQEAIEKAETKQVQPGPEETD